MNWECTSNTAWWTQRMQKDIHIKDASCYCNYAQYPNFWPSSTHYTLLGHYLLCNFSPINYWGNSSWFLHCHSHTSMCIIIWKELKNDELPVCKNTSHKQHYHVLGIDVTNNGKLATLFPKLCCALSLPFGKLNPW